MTAFMQTKYLLKRYIDHIIIIQWTGRLHETVSRWYGDLCETFTNTVTDTNWRVTDSDEVRD